MEQYLAFGSNQAQTMTLSEKRSHAANGIHSTAAHTNRSPIFAEYNRLLSRRVTQRYFVAHFKDFDTFRRPTYQSSYAVFVAKIVVHQPLADAFVDSTTSWRMSAPKPSALPLNVNGTALKTYNLHHHHNNFRGGVCFLGCTRVRGFQKVTTQRPAHSDLTHTASCARRKKTERVREYKTLFTGDVQPSKEHRLCTRALHGGVEGRHRSVGRGCVSKPAP
jgi:hypothetical protein